MAHPTGYSRTQIMLHWLMAALITLQFILHEPIAQAWEAFEQGREVAFNPLIAQHVFGGLLVLLLVVWRLSIRLRRGAPPPPEQEHPVLKMAAHGTHWLLYALMFLMPVSGAAAWFGAVQAAAEAHEVMKFVLLLLVALHVAGALMHRFVLKTAVMQRMVRAQSD
ncbi:MAG: cytochrome b [Brevirhabdus sp.]